MKHKKVLLQVKASIYDSGEFEKTTNITNNKDIVKRLDDLFKAIKNTLYFMHKENTTIDRFIYLIQIIKQ